MDKESKTPEITLRLLDPSDIEDFMELMRDEEVSKWCSWEPYTSKDAAMNYILKVALPHPFFRAICLDNKVVGSISVRPFRGDDSCRAEVGYSVGSKYWGQGVATKAVRMVAMEIFFDWPHLERLEAVVQLHNTASQRVLEKAGFKKEGVFRNYFLFKGVPKDVVIFSFVSSDHQLNCLTIS